LGFASTAQQHRVWPEKDGTARSVVGISATTIVHDLRLI